MSGSDPLSSAMAAAGDTFATGADEAIRGYSAAGRSAAKRRLNRGFRERRPDEP